jgi:hypothetical protein
MQGLCVRTRRELGARSGDVRGQALPGHVRRRSVEAPDRQVTESGARSGVSANGHDIL